MESHLCAATGATDMCTIGLLAEHLIHLPCRSAGKLGAALQVGFRRGNGILVLAFRVRPWHHAALPLPYAAWLLLACLKLWNCFATR